MKSYSLHFAAIFVVTTSAACSSSSASSTPEEDGGAHSVLDAHASTEAFIGKLTITTIGSTVDPGNGDGNPYGLALAPVTAGKMTAGDLIICNFNDKANVQGNGTTIEVLHPTPGSKPTRLVQDPNLKGCAAVASDGQDNPWAASFSSNLAPYYSPTGVLASTLAKGPWDGPWGEAFVTPPAPAKPYFVTANAKDGSLVNVDLSGTTFVKTVTGFSINAGAVPGTIYALSGLTYDPANDTLYVVDSNLNRVVAFAKYSTLTAGAVTVSAKGFTGPSASAARVVFSGAPLSLPISAALLWNGNLVVGNTGGKMGDNLLVEISPEGKVVATQNLDSGAPGALFGIVATGTSAADAKIYFNDDNDNTVKVAEAK